MTKPVPPRPPSWTEAARSTSATNTTKTPPAEVINFVEDEAKMTDTFIQAEPTPIVGRIIAKPKLHVQHGTPLQVMQVRAQAPDGKAAEVRVVVAHNMKEVAAAKAEGYRHQIDPNGIEKELTLPPSATLWISAAELAKLQ
ncbi:MAG: hypothetical protein HY543_09510 [Deltaproteobacteria bacterium]|nr:hypothetical protein [Deltaproteobacteria bacterium]